METEDVFHKVHDQETYEFTVKAGFDGQSGRGKYAIKGKIINDDKW